MINSGKATYMWLNYINIEARPATQKEDNLSLNFFNAATKIKLNLEFVQTEYQKSKNVYPDHFLFSIQLIVSLIIHR